MAITVDYTNQSRAVFDGTQALVAGAGLTTIIEVDSQRHPYIFFEMANSGTVLNAFAIQGRALSDGTYRTLYSAAADFTAPTGFMLAASGDLTTLADAATGWFIMETKLLFDSIRIQAGSGGNTTLTVDAVGGYRDTGL